jgi:TetR/AcrR family transcriptional regulator
MKEKATDILRRDRDRTSGAILSTATELFLERGYAAVPISLIAKQANVTKSLIYHYFGDKRRLWLAVREASVAVYAVRQRAVFSSNETDPNVGGVAASAVAYFSFLQKQPDIARMFALESFDGDFEPGDTEQELQAGGIAFVEQLQSSGGIRADLDPGMVLAAFNALIEHWFISQERVAKLNKKRKGPTLDAEYLDAIEKILSSGLRPL